MSKSAILAAGLCAAGVIAAVFWFRQGGGPETPAQQSSITPPADGSELIASFKTNYGKFDIKLFYDKTPVTVSNFVGLARKGFYDNIIFHRIIDGFMIQGGDPTGTGMGGPGYRFRDEFHPSLRHARKGVLSMANAGPNTNGSQFFITLGATPHLDDRHAVFGEVVEGLDVVEKIGKVPTAAQNRPVEKVVIEKLTIAGDWFSPISFEKLPERG